MSTRKEEWLLVEVAGYDVNNNLINARSVSTGLPMHVALEDGQKKNWIGWLSDTSRAESAPIGSVLALYNVKPNARKVNHYTAGWGTTISKDISSESIVVAPFTVSHTVKTFPNKNEKYIDGIALDNQSVFIENIEDVRDIASAVIDNPSTPLVGQRGFMIRAVSPHNSDEGHIEAFYGRKGLTGQQVFDYHFNRDPLAGFRKNRLKHNLDNIHFANKGNSELRYEVVGFSRSIIQTYGSEKKLQSLSQMPNYRIPGIGDIPPRQAFSYAALVVDPSRPNVIKHHLPLPRAKIVNSLFGVLDISEQQKRAVGVISSAGKQNQFTPRPTSYKESAKAPLYAEDYLNQSGKVRSFRIYAHANNINDFSDRIKGAIPGVKPFMVDNAYSFPIEYKKQLSSSLSDLLHTPPLYLREVRIDGSPRLVIDGRIKERQFASQIENIKRAVPHSHDGKSNAHFDIASYDQLSWMLDKIPPAVTKPEIAPTQVVGQLSAPTPPSQKETDKPHKASFADWLEAKFMGRYDAMVNYLYSEIQNFAEREAHIDWEVSADNADIGNGNSRGALISRSGLVKPIKGSETHSGSVAFAVNTYEKSDPKYANPLRWFNINFINKKIKREGAFVFNGYEFLKDAYERDNGLVLSNNTEDRLNQLEEERQVRALRAEQKAQEVKEKEEKTRVYWMNTFPSFKNETGTTSVFTKKQISSVLGHIPLKMGVDKNLGRFTAIRLHDIDNNFRGVQRLFEKAWQDSDGKWDNKLFSSGSIFKDSLTDQKYGTHCVIGNIESNGPIYFGEGFSTCASIFEATGTSTVVALNAGNLPCVVEAYRRKYPDRQLIIVSDNDKWKPKKGNAGVTAAITGSYESNAHFIIPEFNSQDTGKTPTDANDLRVLSGIDSLRSQLRNIQDPITERSVYEMHRVENCGLEALDKTIKEIVASHSELERSPLTRSLLYSAINQYGKQEVLEQLAPEFKEYVTFSKPQNSASTPKEHLVGPEVSVLEAISPSQKKYCLIKDNTDGKHTTKINDALRSVVGNNALAYNDKLRGWVAPYPTLNILKSYLFNETNSPQLYIGKSRSKYDNRFVIRGNYDDEAFRESIIKEIGFANPRYLKSEYGLVIDDNSHLDNVKKYLASYLIKPSLARIEELKSNDPQQQRIENLLEQARRVSGEPNSNIVQTLHRLTNGNQPAIFSDDDYIFAGLYSRSFECIDLDDNSDKHFKALNEASNTYISLDRQGVLDGILSSDQRQSCKALAIHIKSIVRNNVHMEDAAISEIQEKHGLDGSAFNSIFLGEHISEELEQDRSEVLSSIRGVLAKQSYSASLKIDNNVEMSVPKLSQGERVSILLELTELAAKEGYSLEEYQEIFIRSVGSPYHPRGGEYSPTMLQSDIVFIDRNRMLGDDSGGVTTEAGLFEHYAESAADKRLSQYYIFIDAMVEERGHLTYESFSAYLKGKRKSGVDAINPYFTEGEFNEELLSEDVARLTMYKNHQALYQEYGASVLNNNDIFSHGDTVDQEGSSDKQSYLQAHEHQLNIDDEDLTCLDFSECSQSNTRLRCQINNADGESLAIDEWFRDIDSVPNYIRAIKAGETPEDEPIESDVLQHVIRDGATYAVSRLLVEPERYFISGGHQLVNKSTNILFTDKLEAQKVFANGKKKLLSGPSVETNEMSGQTDNLPGFIKQCARQGLSVDEFTHKLSEQYNVEIKPELQQAIERQYQLLLKDKLNRNIAPDEARFEKLQESVTQLITDGLDYDDIYEGLMSSEGTLGKKNPYIDGNGNFDRKGFVADIQTAGYSSLRKLYENRYAAIHGNPYQNDMLPRSSTLLPSTIILDAPLKAQMQLLVDTVSDYKMHDIAFDKNNFPTFREWQKNTASYIPIHPILAIDLKHSSAREQLEANDMNAIRMLADIHGVNTLDDDKQDISGRIINQWSARSLISGMTVDELRDLSQDERNEIAVGLGMSEAHKSVSASAISKYISKLNEISEQRIKEYSYIVASIAYEDIHGKLPNYAARAIAHKIETGDQVAAQSETKQMRQHYSRCEADTAIKVLSAVSSIRRNSFSSENIKQVEVVSQSGKDYIGSYKHFYAPTSSSVNLPHEISHYGRYENSVYGLPYALTAEECGKANLSPLSQYATKKVCSSLDSWLSEHGAVGMSAPNTGSLFVIGRKNDRTFLVEYHGNGFEPPKSGELHELIGQIPTELLTFTDRNEISEHVGKAISVLNQISYAEIESRLVNRADKELDNAVSQLCKHKTFEEFLRNLRDESPEVVIHSLARKLAEYDVECVLNGRPQDKAAVNEFLASLPDPSPIPLGVLERMSSESKAIAFGKNMPIEGIAANSKEYQEIKGALQADEVTTSCVVSNYLLLVEKEQADIVNHHEEEFAAVNENPLKNADPLATRHVLVQSGDNTLFCGLIVSEKENAISLSSPEITRAIDALRSLPKGKLELAVDTETNTLKKASEEIKDTSSLQYHIDQLNAFELKTLAKVVAISDYNGREDVGEKLKAYALNIESFVQLQRAISEINSSKRLSILGQCGAKYLGGTIDWENKTLSLAKESLSIRPGLSKADYPISDYTSLSQIAKSMTSEQKNERQKSFTTLYFEDIAPGIVERANKDMPNECDLVVVSTPNGNSWQLKTPSGIEPTSFNSLNEAITRSEDAVKAITDNAQKNNDKRVLVHYQGQLVDGITSSVPSSDSSTPMKVHVKNGDKSTELMLPSDHIIHESREALYETYKHKLMGFKGSFDEFSDMMHREQELSDPESRPAALYFYERSRSEGDLAKAIEAQSANISINRSGPKYELIEMSSENVPSASIYTSLETISAHLVAKVKENVQGLRYSRVEEIEPEANISTSHSPMIR